ncbi:MAG: hypothetical protein M1829_001794 [Trizodia sp. TS-e1964]|nr:MAG: hypothetical protein M1829_001794 [Trizodia sp. TS-e1964]
MVQSNASQSPLSARAASVGLVDHRLVNSSVAELKFNAAASYQLLSSHDPGCAHAKNDNLLVVSPYTTLPHLLNLDHYDLQCQLLAKALTLMKPVRDDYATCPYVLAFNWDQVFKGLQQMLAQEEDFEWDSRHVVHLFHACKIDLTPCSSFYIVVFRSRVAPTTVLANLAKMDEKSHAEAMASGGLLKYWFGAVKPPTDMNNLATCIWRDRADAAPGSAGEGHRAAAAATRGFYEEWKIERLRLTIDDGAQSWSISNWATKAEHA